MSLSDALHQLKQAAGTSSASTPHTASSSDYDFRAANRALESCGLAPLPLRPAAEEAAILGLQVDAMVPSAAAAAAALIKMCEQHEARGRTLERALKDAERAERSGSVWIDDTASKVAAEHERNLAALQSQLDRARADGSEKVRHAAEAVKAAELAAKQLKQKVAVQAQQLRQREAEAQRLQVRILLPRAPRAACPHARARHALGPPARGAPLACRLAVFCGVAGQAGKAARARGSAARARAAGLRGGAPARGAAQLGGGQPRPRAHLAVRGAAEQPGGGGRGAARRVPTGELLATPTHPHAGPRHRRLARTLEHRGPPRC